MKRKRISRKTARAIDTFAIDELKIPELLLMENAGRNATEIISKLIEKDSKVLIVAGKGNNGGDGFVIARQLHRLGFSVIVCTCGNINDPITGSAGINRNAWMCLKGETFYFKKDFFLTASKKCQLIVDALYGTGLQTAVREKGVAIIQAINDCQKPVFSIDLPSGLDCDTGKPLGACVKATWTCSFLAPKKGFTLNNAKNYTGEVFVADIGFDMELAKEIKFD